MPRPHVLCLLCVHRNGRLEEVAPGQWEAPRLERLNLFGCRHLAPASLAAILAGSPRLRHLDVNGCNQLDGVVITGE